MVRHHSLSLPHRVTPCHMKRRCAPKPNPLNRLPLLPRSEKAVCPMQSHPAAERQMARPIDPLHKRKTG